MSYLSTALARLAEQHGFKQADICRQSGLSRAHVSRIFNGESKDLSDYHFAAVLKTFAADPHAQAEIVAARCMDARTGPGSDLVEIQIKRTGASDRTEHGMSEHVHLSKETERAFAFLRSQCPINPDLEKHLVTYAKLMGLK